VSGPAGAPGLPPEHYRTDSGMDVFDVVDDYGLGFFEGNALKYIVRAHKKGDFNGDIGKAIHYVEEIVNRLPQHRPGFIWEYAEFVDIPSSRVIEVFGLDVPLANAVKNILDAELLDSAQTAEYYYEAALTALRAALAMSPEL
jgi:hypothetical protein